MRVLLVLAAALPFSFPGSPAPGRPHRISATAPSWVTYRAPVVGPVVDPFRPPAGPYAAGNRGIDYATTPGEPVVAAAPGVVTFAGPVGGLFDVVVLHADRLRTTYAGLADITVAAGTAVEAGDPVGHTGDRVHFGARAGAAYIDPALLVDPPSSHARLVPVDP